MSEQDQFPTAPQTRVRAPITPERAEIFLDALRKTGSLHAAAAAASPHLVRRGSKHCSIGGFREYAKRNPEFATAVEACLTEVRGRMESLVLERALTPDPSRPYHQGWGPESNGDGGAPAALPGPMEDADGTA